ncbi:MAG TPA: molybdopterin cofactor-binding domain-containing protein, partial [Candidatus Deferrimicrobium sp.]|nr:molybdopterin cofactor-binding domain-containing protein [Candidatus Deferrimicrobium sp.]
MTIRTSPGRTTSPVAPSRSASDALVVSRGAVVPGRARPAAPLRREGPAKLTGEAKYADDLVFPGAWFGATIRSTDAHARFDGYDLDPALDWSRIAVVTAADIPGENVVSLISDDQPVLVPIGGEIQHHAEPLVLLAAADRETLRRARRAVTIRTTPLAPVLDPLESKHVFAHYEIAAGDLERGFAAADFVLEGEYRVGHQEQLYIENQAMIAVPREDGGVAVHGSLQCPYYIHKALKRALKLSDSQAVVIQAETGGGFGGKEEYPSMIAIHAGGPYACANVRIRARTMATNTPPNGAFRGFGAPQVEFAAEVQMGRL